jgi:hypothetical protein
VDRSTPAVEVFFFHHVHHLSLSLQAAKKLKRLVGHMIVAERSALVAVEENMCLLPPNSTP